MLILSTTNQSLEIVLSGAVTTNQLDWTAHWADSTATSFVEGSSHGVTNGATAVEMVAAPAASTKRVIKNVTFFNNDTTSAAIFIKVKDGVTERVILKKTLLAGEQFVYDSTAAAASNGGTGDVMGPASSTDGHIASFDGSTGKLLKDTLAVVTTVGNPGSNTNIATEAAVRSAIAGSGGDVSGPASSTDNALVRFDSTTGKAIQNGTITEDDSGTLASVNAVKFGTSPTVTPTVGQLYRDSVENTLAVNLDTTNGVTLSIGTEQYLRVVNKTGSTIADGKAVYINGAQGNRPTIALARADAIATSMLIGIATQDIANNAEGFITINGDVHNFNTSGYTAGDILYLSAATAGELTNTAPSTPNNVVIVATACNSTASGQITVNLQKPLATNTALGSSDIIAPSQNAVKTYADTKKPYHGIQASGTLTFDNSTHVLTMGAGTNTYWYLGTKYTTASAITCDLDSYITLTTNTLYFVYFDDATGTLKASASALNLKTQVPVATVYWNGSAGSIGKETHSHTRDLDWHVWAHTTVGARYNSGLGLTLPTTAVDGSLQIDAGSIYDEDLLISISQQTTMRGYYQVSSGVYTWVDYSLPYLGTAGVPTYLNTGTYTLTTFASNRYVCYWVFATNDIDKPIAMIPTHASTTYSSVANARAETQPSIPSVNNEWKLIYRFIYAGDGQFQESQDYRTQTSLAGGVSASTNASAVVFAPSGNIAATNVQTAIEELDTEKAALVSPSFTTPVLGTPTSGTLTNCTGYTEANVVFTDVTTNNASATKHGYLPKLENTGTKYLKDDGTWATVSASGSSFWTAITATRASNTTCTVTGDQTAIFKKGMVLRWKESSVDRMAMVSIPSTVSTDTTITFVGDTMASIDSNSFKYMAMDADIVNFAVAGTIGATGSDIANAWYAHEPLRVLGADLYVGTAGTTNSTTIDINKGGTTMFTTKPTLATTVAASTTPFTADTTSALALNDKVTIDVDAVQTTAATDLYVKLYVVPTRYLGLT